jgi:integrase
MPNLLLTDLSIQKLKWNGATTVYWDDNLPSFGIRIGKKKKTFITIRGAARKVDTIGHYPQKTLKEAKKEARTVLAAAPEDNAGKPYADAVEAFLEAKKSLKPATVTQYKSYLDYFGFTGTVSQVTKEEILQKLKRWDSQKWAQNYAYAAIRGFLNWCTDQQPPYLNRSPLRGTKEPNKTKPRARVLSDQELGRIWRCSTPDTYGRIMRLMILTGQRRIEVRNLKPEDVADSTLTFRLKGDKMNVLPITPMIEKELVLPFKFNNWSDAKRRFDDDCGISFQHRDLRRTFATKLAALGVEPHIIERFLHPPPEDVEHIYNKYRYLKEMRNALILYETYIRMIVLTDKQA